MLGPLFVYLKQGTQRRRFSQSTQEGEGAQSFMGAHRRHKGHSFFISRKVRRGQRCAEFYGVTQNAQTYTEFLFCSAVVYTPNGGRKCNVRTL